MKTIELKKPLTQITGEEIKKTNDPNSEAFTVRDALINILGSIAQASGEEKIKAYRLGVKIFEAQEVIHLEEADFGFVKNQVKDSQFYTALIVGQLLEYFNQIKEKDVERET